MSPDKTSAGAVYSRPRIRAMIFAVILSMVVQGFAMFKFVPMQDAVQSFFNINEGAYGILTTAQNWLVIVCSIPMGYLARRLPCRWGVFAGIGAAAAGIAVQILTDSYPVFVAGRMLEGGGFSFVALTSASLLLNLVPENRKSFWSSIYIVSAVLPQVIITKGGSVLMNEIQLSFQNIFVIIGAMYIAVMAVWLIIMPTSLKVHGIADDTRPTKEQTGRVFRNSSNWLISVAFIFFSAVSVIFTSYVIKYLGIKGMDPGQAADIYSYTTLLGLAAMIFFGWLSDRLGTKRKIVIAGYMACAAAMVLLVKLPVNLIFIYVIVYGTLPRSIAGLTSAASVDIAEVPTDLPIVNSVRNTLTQVGSVVMGLVMGYLIQYAGYEITIYALAAMSVAGGVLWAFAKKIP